MDSELDLAPIEARWDAAQATAYTDVTVSNVHELNMVARAWFPALIAEVKRLRADLEIVRAHRDTVVQEVSKENERLRAEVERLKGQK